MIFAVIIGKTSSRKETVSLIFLNILLKRNPSVKVLWKFYPFKCASELCELRYVKKKCVLSNI